MLAWMCAFPFAVTLTLVVEFGISDGHGHLTLPKSNRVNATPEIAGFCEHGECLFFSHNVSIPGEPTLNDERFRTMNVKVQSGPTDWSRKYPWRAPGTAPVFGSGCGSAGGGPVADHMAYAKPPPGAQQGDDPLYTLPEREAVIWQKGSIQEVAWAISANHGGGYSYRLCPKHGKVDEECFQRTVLHFSGDKQWIQYGNLTQTDGSVLHLPRFELPLVRVTEGTHPPGTEWARNPIPNCLICDQNECAGLTPQESILCSQRCAGCYLQACPPGMTHFPEPLPGLSGHTPKPNMKIEKMTHWVGFPFSIVDKVKVPNTIPGGEYLLSWRWDSEMGPQVWQNCADVKITDNTNLV